MARFRPLARGFFVRSPELVARDLLGRYLVRELGDERLVLRLVETEAYLGARDAAAHTFGGRRTARVRSMYLGGGHAYVYFTYGMHHCLNLVCGEVDSGTAVLLRGGDPVEGESRMRANRGLAPEAKRSLVAGGPARLCRALDVDRRHDGLSILAGQLWLAEGTPAGDAEVEWTPRIGVDYAGEAATWPLRFLLKSIESRARRSARAATGRPSVRRAAKRAG